jgi:hypothetical protein
MHLQTWCLMSESMQTCGVSGNKTAGYSHTCRHRSKVILRSWKYIIVPGLLLSHKAVFTLSQIAGTEYQTDYYALWKDEMTCSKVRYTDMTAMIHISLSYILSNHAQKPYGWQGITLINGFIQKVAY